MMKFGRDEITSFLKEYKSEPVNRHRFFSVLLLFVEKDGEMYLIFEKRGSAISQPGEICFPGGRVEKRESPKESALRECEEELGIYREEIELLTVGDILYGQADFTLYSFLGMVTMEVYKNIKPSKDEVEEVYLIPLSFFLAHEPEIYREEYTTNLPNFPYETAGISKEYPWRRGTMEIPIYQYENVTIWGMTAQILRKMTQKIKEYERNIVFSPNSV